MKSMSSEIKADVASVQKTGRTTVKVVAGKIAVTSKPVVSEKPEKRTASTATPQPEAGKVVAKTAPRTASAAARKVTAKAATTTTTKTEATPKAAAKAVSKAKAAPIKRSAIKPVEHTDEEIRQMIATAAYYRAEKRGFAVGYEREDWLMAEKEVDQILTFGK